MNNARGLGRVRHWLIVAGTWAVFPALVATVGAIAGLWSALYAAEMKESVSVLIRTPSAFFALPNESFVGWLLFFAFFLLFAVQQWAKNGEERGARGQLLEESNKLKQLVERLERMPPEGFLAEFQSYYREVATVAPLPYSEEVTADGLAEAIRAVLRCLAGLASMYDASPDRAAYSANIMLCRNEKRLATLTLEELEALETELVFCPDVPAPKVNRLSGVLSLEPELSTRFGTDNNVTIALPLPDAAEIDLGEQGKRAKALPGAPLAAATHAYAAFESLEAMLLWCDERADLTKATVSEIKDYFQSGAGVDIKSFISIPLTTRLGSGTAGQRAIGAFPVELGDGNVEECVGVLNIDSNRPNMLRGAYALFVPLTEPFCQLLASLVVAYDAERRP